MVIINLLGVEDELDLLIEFGRPYYARLLSYSHGDRFLHILDLDYRRAGSLLETGFF